INQCRQLRRTEADLHKTIDELAAVRRSFADQIQSMDRDAVALEKQFTNIETRDLVSDIDVVHSLTARYQPWSIVLIGAIFLLILISVIGLIAVLRPIDKLLKALRAYRRQGVKPSARMRSRIREFNDMIGWLRLFVELTDREQAKRTAIASKYSELLSEAHRDSLTGVANRRALQEALSRAVPLLADTAVLMIDIDHFKVLNDTKGHLFGDRILAAVGDVLRRHVSHKDSVYRYGGEEFCLVLTGVTSEQAQSVANRLLEKVRSISRESAENMAPEVAPEPLTISIGISSVLTTIGEKPLDKLIAEADDALYEAKNKGRNQVVVYIEKKRSESHHRHDRRE
ncbi:MAG: diguanylate cyclase domain-containing protein, partial [Sutterella sp.]